MDINRICNLVTVAEKPYPRRGVAQCHRCQQFRHSSHNCQAEARCVKCAGCHRSDACSRPNHSAEIPPKCVNCGGEHPASYRGCKRFPTGRNKGRKPDTPKAPRAPAPPKVTNQGIKPTPTPSPLTVNPAMFEQFLAWARHHQPLLIANNGY